MGMGFDPWFTRSTATPTTLSSISFLMFSGICWTAFLPPAIPRSVKIDPMPILSSPRNNKSAKLCFLSCFSCGK